MHYAQRGLEGEIIIKHSIARFILATVLFGAFTVIPGWSQEKNILQNITILSEEYPPYSFLGNHGTVEGTNTEQVRKALTVLGLNLPIQILPWARAYIMARDGENIFLYTCSRTKEREDDFKWVSELSKSDVAIYALSERKIKITSPSDLKKFRIGGVIGYRYLPWFERESIDTLDLTPSDENNLKKLQLGRIDLMVTNSDQLNWILKKQNINPSIVNKVYEIRELLTIDYIVTGKKTSDEVVNLFRKSFR